MTSGHPPPRDLFLDQELQRGIDESGIGIWELDLSTRALFWSSATKRLFG
ncbi:MAG: hypothetical protein IT564_12105, partial [Rhodospirillales bacterium]|nr:hypothetical protein [Rhodospirillales bacterium]